MGSPLGVLFANFFMGSVVELEFEQIDQPAIYCRYIDDIFVQTDSLDKIDDLRRNLMEVSGLDFTVEHSEGGSLPFLDVLLKQTNCSFSSSVYVKGTYP